jgi:hypothetical protein
MGGRELQSKVICNDTDMGATHWGNQVRSRGEACQVVPLIITWLTGPSSTHTSKFHGQIAG